MWHSIHFMEIILLANHISLLNEPWHENVFWFNNPPYSMCLIWKHSIFWWSEEPLDLCFLALMPANVGLPGVVPMVEAWSDRHGVERQSQAQVTNGQVDNEVLGRFQEMLFLVGDVQQCAVAKQRTHTCRKKKKQTSCFLLHRADWVTTQDSGASVNFLAL